MEEKSFEQKFQNFSCHIQHFRDCYEKSREIIGQLKNVFRNDLNAGPNNAFISDKEKEELDDFVTKKASVLVIGQTNSGKSSLINELLGGSYLPTAEVPCTSRIVRIRYSEKNVLRVREPTGSVLKEQKEFKKKSRIPREEIALNDSKRDDKEWARCVVEVGLDNPLLQGGHLEFVDAPGMSENDVLDSIVQECIHGILQVVIYVIDGNSSFRSKDREFLYNLKVKLGSVPIFYVCNKVDVDKKAARFDRDGDDDDDDDESYLKPENQMKIIESKKMLAFSALVRSSFIDKNEDVDSCEFFHAISTREIRQARRGKTKSGVASIDEVHMAAFERMKLNFLKFASASINTYLMEAAKVLRRIQQRIFDFYVSRNFKNCELFDIKKVTAILTAEEEKCFQSMRQYVMTSSEKLERIITRVIETEEQRILSQAADMEFAPIAISDVVHRNEIINQYKNQIQKMVLMTVLNTSLRTSTRTVKTVTTNVREQLRRTLGDASKRQGIAGKLVNQQLRHSEVLTKAVFNPSGLISMAQVKDYSLMTLTFKTLDPTKTFFADVMSIITGTTVNKDWKRKVAKNVFDNVDRTKLTNRIIGAILDSLHDGHHTFQTNIMCIESLCTVAEKQSQQQALAISKYGPSFAKVICFNDALLESLSYPDLKLDLQPTCKTGQRGIVYDCNGEFAGNQVVAKRLHPETSKLMYLSIQHSLKRIDEENNHVLRPMAVLLIDNQMTLLLPKLNTDLYTALTNGSLKPPSREDETRLAILHHVTDACIFCRERGIQLIDPRVSNVLVDEHWQAKLNISKPREDAVCYPDGLAPFHVYAAAPPLEHPSAEVLQFATRHDVYALGTMGWLLAMGQYQRPLFAQTKDITKIYEAAGRRTNPDIELIPEDFEKIFEGFGNLLMDCWVDGISLWDLRDRIDQLLKQ